MTQEVPQKVDLSQDIKTQSIYDKLTPEEQQSFQEYIANLKEEEKQSVLYLTHQELNDLKSILSYGVDTDKNSTQQTLQEFITTQAKEGISSQDILASIDGIPDGVGDILDTTAVNVLFGNEGILKQANITDEAKDSITTSFGLSILENLTSGELTRENITRSMTGIHDRLNNLAKLIEPIQTIPITGEQDKISKVEIAGNGDKNYIFADVNIGKDFFNGIFSGAISSENMQKYIEDRNLPDGSTTKIEQNMIQVVEDMKKLPFLQKAAPEVQGSKNNKDAVKAPKLPTPADIAKAASEVTGETVTEEDVQEGKLAGWIGAIISGIKEIMEMFGDYVKKVPETIQTAQNTDKKSDTDTSKAPQKKPDNSDTEEVIRILRMSGNNATADFYEKNEVTPEQQKKMMDTIQSIDPSKTITEIMKEMYGTNPEEGRYMQAMTTFSQYGFYNTLPTDMSLFEKSLRAMEEYAQYRNDPRVAGKTKGRLKWEKWAQERKDKNWEKA